MTKLDELKKKLKPDPDLAKQINEETRGLSKGKRSMPHTYGAEHRDNFID